MTAPTTETAVGRIYIASKSKHGGRWLAGRRGGVPFSASWIDEWEPGTTADWSTLWARCIAEAAACDALILYMEPGEALKGALVEVGAALAAGRPVFVVAPAGTFSFQEHPLVTTCRDLVDAIEMAGHVIAAGRAALAAQGGEAPR